jgi:hypothetical protein
MNKATATQTAVITVGAIVAADIGYQLARHHVPILIVIACVLAVLFNAVSFAPALAKTLRAARTGA